MGIFIQRRRCDETGRFILQKEFCIVMKKCRYMQFALGISTSFLLEFPNLFENPKRTFKSKNQISNLTNRENTELSSELSFWVGINLKKIKFELYLDCQKRLVFSRIQFVGSELWIFGGFGWVHNSVLVEKSGFGRVWSLVFMDLDLVST